MAQAAHGDLAGVVKDRVVAASDADYDETRALFNAMIDKHPAAIAYCTDERDVVRTRSYPFG